MADEYYYEAELSNAMAEAEAIEHEAYQQYLGNLLANGETALFAAYVALDWLTSREFAESGLSEIEFIQKQKQKFEARLLINTNQ